MSSNQEYQRCPVCGGKGLVPAGFYNPVQEQSLNSTQPETCNRCNGTGTILRPTGNKKSNVSNSVLITSEDIE